MMRVSPPAVTELKSVLTASQAPDDAGVRLAPAENGAVSLTIDKPKPGDDVVKEGDRPLLIVDASIARRMDEVMFDVAPDPERPGGGKRFVFRQVEAGA
jgi:hypothetical protein